MAPRNLSNSLLDTFALAQIEFVPLLDVIEIASRESLEIWKLARQIRCDLLDHTITPPARHLALGDQPAEIPIEQKELAVDGHCGFDLGSLNPRLEVGDELPIVLGGRSDSATWAKGRSQGHATQSPHASLTPHRPFSPDRARHRAPALPASSPDSPPRSGNTAWPNPARRGLDRRRRPARL